jgi:hypothetical protein
MSREQLLVGVATTAHPTVDVEQAVRRRVVARSRLHRDPDRVQLQPTGVELAGHRLRERRLARPGRAADEDQTPSHVGIVPASTHRLPMSG